MNNNPTVELCCCFLLQYSRTTPCLGVSLSCGFGGCWHGVLCFGVEFMAYICVVFQLGCGAMLNCHGVYGMSHYLWLCHICVVCSNGWGVGHSLSIGMSSDCS